MRPDTTPAEERSNALLASLNLERLTLNQRVQGSSPCAPTILKLQKKFSVMQWQFLCQMASGSAPGKHFLQIKSASRIHNEAIQATAG
jgi:hypothetical protein